MSKKVKSAKRGGAGAPEACKRELGECTRGIVCGGGSWKKAGKACMVEFNSCRASARRQRKSYRISVAKSRKSRKGARRGRK